MMNILFFDTETTGMLSWKERTHDPCQPHIVQLSAILHDENRKTRAAMNVIIRPDDWEIPEDVQQIHGISTEDALKYGVPRRDALQLFSSMVSLADLVVGHSVKFDVRVTRAQLHREAMDNPFEGKETFCTMFKSPRVPGPHGAKLASLQEAHIHFFGEGFDNAHDAMADTLACSWVYYQLA